MPAETLENLYSTRKTIVTELGNEASVPLMDTADLFDGLTREEYCQYILTQIGGRMDKLGEDERQAIVHLIADRFTGYLHCSYDVDKTLIDKGQKRTPDGVFDPGGYYEKYEISNIDMENLDLNILTALFGSSVTIQTGKEANVWPMATYMRERMAKFAEWLSLEQYEDGRYKTLGGDRPVVFLFGVGNGGLVMDLSAPGNNWGEPMYPGEKDNDPSWPPENWVVYKPITLDAWQWLYDHSELLRASTKLERRAALVGIDGMNLDEEFFHDPKNLKAIESMVSRHKKVRLGSENLPLDVETRALVGNLLASHSVPGYEHNPIVDDVLMVPRVPLHKTDPVDDSLRYLSRFPITDQKHHPQYNEKVNIRTYKREIAPKLTEIEEQYRMELQSRIRDFALFTSFGTKANLVLDVATVSGKNGDTSVQKMWEDITEQKGKKITIQNEDDLIEALKLITNNAPFYWFRSIDHEQVFIDISALGTSRYKWTEGEGYSLINEDEPDIPIPIHKGESARLCKNYTAAVYEAYGVKPAKIYSAAAGDNHDIHGNDASMTHKAGGMMMSKNANFPLTDDGWPIKWVNVFGKTEMREIEFTRLMLYAQLYSRIGYDVTRITNLRRFLLLLENERRISSVDIPAAIRESNQLLTNQTVKV